MQNDFWRKNQGKGVKMIHQPIPDIFKNKRLIALDLETTGLSVVFNTIIELGVVEVQNGVVVQRYSRLFGGGHSAMYLVRKIHQIRDSERKFKPTFKSCAEKISKYLSNAILVAHNGNAFDIPMIQNKCSASGFPLENIKVIDTLQLARKMRKKEGEEGDEKKQRGHNTLENLCKEFGLQYGGDEGGRSHHGLEDSEACLDLLFYMVNNNKVEISI